ncbi:MAG: sodium:calcium antiporter [Candidatus Altiarchaeota archaeon]|nr:sodium:calcium antiporter [Candidatus Altiarchaeota archaeon]
MPFNDLLVHLTIFLISCIVLAKSAEFLVKALIRIASFFGWTEFVIGFIVMAVATSIPELFVGITSALNKNSALALGTVIGSNIADLTLVIGIVALVARGIKVESKMIRTDTLYMFGIATLPLILMLDQELSRFDGYLLISVFSLYGVRLLKQKVKFRKTINTVSVIEFTNSIGLFCFSVIVLFFSSHFVVEYATLLSLDLMLPPILIGLFMISFGTSLPELMFDIRAVRAGHRDMALGDLMGSVIANSTLVLGVTALIYPISANFLLFLTSASFMIVVAFLFMTFVESEERISWQEGIALIFMYVFFIIVELNVRLLQVSV